MNENNNVFLLTQHTMRFRTTKLNVVRLVLVYSLENIVFANGVTDRMLPSIYSMRIY